MNLGDYHELYLTTDVLILADVFGEIRDTCMSNYGLDPAHSFTSPGLAWQAALKMSDVQLDLFTDIEMHLFIKRGIRGGVAIINTVMQKLIISTWTTTIQVKKSNLLST